MEALDVRPLPLAVIATSPSVIHVWSLWAGTVPVVSLTVLHIPMFLPPWKGMQLWAEAELGPSTLRLPEGINPVNTAKAEAAVLHIGDSFYSTLEDAQIVDLTRQ